MKQSFAVVAVEEFASPAINILSSKSILSFFQRAGTKRSVTETDLPSPSNNGLSQKRSISISV